VRVFPNQLLTVIRCESKVEHTNTNAKDVDYPVVKIEPFFEGRQLGIR